MASSTSAELVAVQTDGHDFYVPIPKCASSSLRHCFPDWRGVDKFEGDPDNGWVVVRHPVERWFSAMAETAKEPERPFELLLDEVRATGKLVYDAHSAPQWNYVKAFPDIDIVRIESVNGYVRERYGRRLTWKNAKTWDVADDLVPLVEDFYARDLEVWQQAR